MDTVGFAHRIFAGRWGVGSKLRFASSEVKIDLELDPASACQTALREQYVAGNRAESYSFVVNRKPQATRTAAQSPRVRVAETWLDRGVPATTGLGYGMGRAVSLLHLASQGECVDAARVGKYVASCLTNARGALSSLSSPSVLPQDLDAQ